jgi:hypothetical protein
MRVVQTKKRIAVAFFVVLLTGAAVLQGLSTNRAVAASANISGEFACLINKNLAGFDNSMPTTGPNTVNILSYVNFDNLTFELVTSNTNNFNQSNAESSTDSANGSITVEAGPIAASRILNFVVEGVTSVRAIVIVANSGNTLLVSYPYQVSTSEPGSGVCQKL